MSRHSEFKAAGLCAQCGRVAPAPNRVSCSACLKKAREAQKLVLARRKSKGLCTQCGQRPARPNRTTCEICSAQIRERDRDRYLERKQANLCAQCGKQPPVVGKALCLQCQEKYYASNKLREQKSPRYQAMIRDNFTCQLCGSTERLAVHHIDGNGQSKNGKRVPAHLANNEITNLITVCGRCHADLTHTINRIVNVPLFFSLIQAQR